MPLSLRYGAVSDVGRSRKKNDDSGYAGPHFLIVADGMGGAPAGDLASAVAVQTMQRLDEPPAASLLETLAGALHRANDRLGELIEDDPSIAGMGTTVTAALFDGQRIGLCHLGDSRGYLWRGGELLRMTHDHTWVQSLIDEGRITEEEAKTHSHRSLILKVLDGRHDNEPDLTLYDLQLGDRILLCSDGLSGFVDHDRIERVLAVGTAQSVAEELLQLALEAASTDNITVVVADVVGESPNDVATAAGSGAASAHGGTVAHGVHASAPLVLGAAANQPRRPRSRLRSWAHGDDTGYGESLLDPAVDPEELRYAPRAPQHNGWLRRSVILAVGLALVAILATFSYGWTQRQFYVASADGKVAIYQGVQPGLPGLNLHRVHETHDLLLTELPSFRRTQVVDGMPAGDLDDAERIIEQLQAFADGCAAQAAAATSKQSSTAAPSLRPPPDSSTGKSVTPTEERPTKPQAAPERGGEANEAARPAGKPQTTPRPTDKPQTTPRPTDKSGPPVAERATTAGSATPETGSGGQELSPEECSGATPQTEATS